MTDERSPIRIHVLHCGSMLVSKAVPYGGGVNLKNARHGVFDKVADRVELPVSAYLIEHPKGKVLIDTGWSREISPEGVYDSSAVKRQLPGYLAAFYHPWVPSSLRQWALHRRTLAPSCSRILTRITQAACAR